MVIGAGHPYDSSPLELSMGEIELQANSTADIEIATLVHRKAVLWLADQMTMAKKYMWLSGSDF
ncbi:hypothetical protein GJ744_008101 [Endocarpon pusillum]|uniref:Uncharacterized protein n=1 Tax=Endocarpon pusillum TaxID=364733 RepID=A0A8H7AHX6_9EURO|nr:hypothetical protein GJ744_008101 [Endocarpon pusillum]